MFYFFFFYRVGIELYFGTLRYEVTPWDDVIRYGLL